MGVSVVHFQAQPKVTNLHKQQQQQWRQTLSKSAENTTWVMSTWIAEDKVANLMAQQWQHQQQC
jgi:hypothetical protein